MIRFLLLAVILLTPAATAGQGSSPLSEDVQTRPDKQEIVDWMTRSGQMDVHKRTDRLDRILSQSEGKTPRSDFLFCVGLAYLGDYKAQTCVAKAYESGRGVVEDQIEAYLWYSIASLGDPKLEEVKDRLKNKLQTAYPFPSDEELADQLNEQQSRIKQYQAETKKSSR